MPVTRLGVAGLGGLGEALIKDAVCDAAFELVAVQDVLEGRARDVAERYSAAWHGARYVDLLAVPEVDAVLICTPNALHADQAQAALLAGKDVLVQKPLALSAADANETLRIAERTNRLLFVDYTYRFLETMRVLRDSVGDVRHVRSIRAAFHNIYGPGAEKHWFFNREQSGGGALTDLGVHLIDLGFWLLQPRDVDVAHCELTGEDSVEQSAELGLRLDSVDMDIFVSWNAALSATQIVFEVETRDAAVRWENVEGSFFHFRTVSGGAVLRDCETTLREDTLREFARARATRRAPPIDPRVYSVLDRVYGR